MPTPTHYIMIANAAPGPSRANEVHAALSTIWAGTPVIFSAQAVFPRRGGPLDWPENEVISRANGQAATYLVSTFNGLTSVNYEPYGGSSDYPNINQALSWMISHTKTAVEASGPARPIVAYSQPHVTIQGLMPHDHGSIPTHADLAALCPSAYHRDTHHPQPRDLQLAADLAGTTGKPLWPFVSPQLDGDKAPLTAAQITDQLGECVESGASAVINWLNCGLPDSWLFPAQETMRTVWDTLFPDATPAIVRPPYNPSRISIFKRLSWWYNYE